MADRARLYDALLQRHFARHREMALVSGPRQVGKTTTCRAKGTDYINWDNTDDRRVILRGPAAVAERIGVEKKRPTPPILFFDELYKHAKSRTFLKGFFDGWGKRTRVIVAGSSRLDVFGRGGDSLMGRYLPYRMHPFSVAECVRTTVPTQPIQPPAPIAPGDWDALWEHGGFPEPFLRREKQFTPRWRWQRHDQLTKEDIRAVTQIQDLSALEALSHILSERSSQQLIYSKAAKEVGVTIDTARRWVDVFERMHFGFVLRPWSTNITKALRKEPKWYLRDWSGIEDRGARAETFVACHLLKAVEGWTDLGLGRFELRYIRDKLKREVDFLVVRNRKPWFLVDVKSQDATLSDSLGYFQKVTNAKHAFQLVTELPYVKTNCFERTDPIVVSARTLLSQLL